MCHLTPPPILFHNPFRYVCVLLQYTAKMNAEKLRKAMHAYCNATLAAVLGPQAAAGEGGNRYVEVHVHGGLTD